MAERGRPAAAHVGGVVVVNEFAAWALSRLVRRHPPDLSGMADRNREEWAEAVAALESAGAAVEARIEALRAAAVCGGEGPPRAAVRSSSELDGWMSVDEAAGVLDLSVRRVRELAVSLGGRKVGRDLQIPRRAVEAEGRRRKERV